MGKTPQQAKNIDLTVSEAVDRWLAEKESVLKITSLRRYETLLVKYVIPVYGKKNIRSFTDTELEKLADSLSETLSARTIASVVTTARRVREDTVGDGYEVVRRKRGIGSISSKITQQRNVCTISDIEAKKLNNSLLGDVNPTTFGILICLNLGLRLGEMCALKREDFLDDSVEVSRTIQRVALREVDDYGKKTKLMVMEYEWDDPRRRVLPITDAVREALQSGMIINHGYIITDDGEKTIDSRTMENRLKRILEALRIREANFNTLRDTFAVHCIDQGMDVATISRLLGHTDVGVTGNRYGEYLKKYQQRQLAGVKLAGWG